MDELLKRPDLKDADRCHLLYAFAKMNEDLGCFDAAYDNYVVGGALRKKLLAYDLRETEPCLQRLGKLHQA